MHFRLPLALLSLTSFTSVSALRCNATSLTRAAVGGISVTIYNDVDGYYSAEYHRKGGCQDYGVNHVEWWVQKRSVGIGTLGYDGELFGENWRRWGRGGVVGEIRAKGVG